MTRNIKLAVWHGLVALFAWRLWLFSGTVSFNFVIGFDLSLPAVLTFILLCSFIAIGYVLFQEKKWALGVSAVVVLTFLSYLGWTWLNILAAFGFWFFNIYAASNAKSNMHGRTRLNVRL